MEVLKQRVIDLTGNQKITDNRIVALAEQIEFSFDYARIYQTIDEFFEDVKEELD